MKRGRKVIIDRRQIAAYRDIVATRQKQREKMHDRGTVTRNNAIHHHSPIAIMRRLQILNDRVGEIITEKIAILNEWNVDSYSGLYTPMLKERYTLLNKERKSIQDTFDRISQLLTEQENNEFNIGLCEEL